MKTKSKACPASARLLQQVGQGPLQAALPGDQRDQLDLGTGQVDGGRDAGQTRDRLDLVERSGQRLTVDEDLVDARLPGVVRDRQRRRRVPLGVEVDDEHPQARAGPGRPRC